jgi:hypothetical protein
MDIGKPEIRTGQDSCALGPDRLAEVFVTTDGSIGFHIDESLPQGIQVVLTEAMTEALAQARAYINES